MVMMRHCSLFMRNTEYNDTNEMKSMYTEGSKISFNGIRGTVLTITETYRKNVLVVKVTSTDRVPFRLYRKIKGADTLGIFELPGGQLKFMCVIEPD